MAIAYVNGGAIGGASGSGSINIAMTAGNLVVCNIHVDSHTSGVARGTNVSDAAGNNWVQALISNSAQSGKVQSTQTWYCIAATTGTISVSVAIGTPNDSWNAYFQQFSGVDTKFPFSDLPAVIATDYTTTGAAQTGNQPVSRASGGVCLAFLTTNSTIAAATAGTPTGWTSPIGSSQTGGFASNYGAYKAFTSGGNQAVTFASGAGSSQWCLVGMTLQAPSPITLDGSAKAGSASVSSISASLTTTKTNDIIVAYVFGSSSTARTVSSVTATGLTFTKRSGTTHNSAGTLKNVIEVWWAVAPTAATRTITANFSGVCSDDAMLWVFGVNGADTSNPWDTNVSLPSITTDVTGNFTSQLSTAFSTNGGDRFVFAFGSNNGSSVFNLTNTLGNEVPQQINGSAQNTGTQATFGEYAYNPGAVTSKTTGFPSTAQYWAIFVDALGTPVQPTGTIVTALTKASMAAVGNELPRGTITTNLTKASFALSGWMLPRGTIATALTKLSQSVQGKVSPTAVITTNLTKASFTLNGKEAFGGTINTALTKAAISASATISPRATINTNLSRLSMLASGSVRASGSIVTRLRGITQVLSGFNPPAGQIAQQLRGLSMRANGWAEAIGSVTTDLSLLPAHIAMQARTFEIFTGSIVMDLSGFLQQMQAREIFTGSIVTTLGPVAQDLTGEERILGTIVTRLGNANGTLVANVVQALLIIQGPIETNLAGFDATVLAGLLGTPGAGKWYSWRQTDN
jgi:hypothetical protein